MQCLDACWLALNGSTEQTMNIWTMSDHNACWIGIVLWVSLCIIHLSSALFNMVDIWCLSDDVWLSWIVTWLVSFSRCIGLFLYCLQFFSLDADHCLLNFGVCRRLLQTMHVDFRRLSIWTMLYHGLCRVGLGCLCWLRCFYLSLQVFDISFLSFVFSVLLDLLRGLCLDLLCLVSTFIILFRSSCSSCWSFLCHDALPLSLLLCSGLLCFALVSIVLCWSQLFFIIKTN